MFLKGSLAQFRLSLVLFITTLKLLVFVLSLLSFLPVTHFKSIFRNHAFLDRYCDFGPLCTCARCGASIASQLWRGYFLWRQPPGGACSFSTYTLPSGIYGTALSDSNWDNSGNCGACITVTAGGKSITAMVGDSTLFHADWY